MEEVEEPMEVLVVVEVHAAEEEVDMVVVGMDMAVEEVGMGVVVVDMGVEEVDVVGMDVEEVDIEVNIEVEVGIIDVFVPSILNYMLEFSKKVSINAQIL